MKNIFKKYLVVGSIGAGIIGLVIVVLLLELNAGFRSRASQDNNVFTMKHIDFIYPADFANDEILMGAAHNVFVGRVVRQIGIQDFGVGPETQFAVQVISNIKGDLKGMVTVDQAGGYVGDTVYIAGESDILDSANLASSDYFLKPGGTYLLATRYSPTHDWYNLGPFPFAYKLISRDSALGDDALSSIASNDSRVQQLAAAYKNEIPLNADVAHGNDRNSYRSLQSQSLDDVSSSSTPTSTVVDSASSEGSTSDDASTTTVIASSSSFPTQTSITSASATATQTELSP